MVFAHALAPLLPSQTPVEIVDSLEGLRETPVGRLLLENMPPAWGVKLAAAVQTLARQFG